MVPLVGHAMGHVDPWVHREVTSLDAFHLDHEAIQSLEVQEGLEIDVVAHMEDLQVLDPYDPRGPSHLLAPSY